MRRSIMAFLLGAALSTDSQAMTIDLYADEHCSSKCLVVPFLEERYFTIRVRRNGESAAFVGAHFRVSGMTWGWSWWVEPVAGAFVSGDLLSQAGATVVVSWNRESDCIDLCRVKVRANSFAASFVIQVEAGEPPFAGFTCPVYWSPAPDDPYEMVLECAEGGALLVTQGSECETPALHPSWGQMKLIYRE